MKEILTQYADYNVWANRLLVDVLITLSDDDIQKDLGGSFGCIKATVHHIYGAESIWLQRLQMTEHVLLPADMASFDTATLCKNWIEGSENLASFAHAIRDERGFEHQYHYKNVKNELFKSKVWESLQHVNNHSTFHRGQIITYLRQLGKAKLPSTDFITYCRGRK
ncbi:MAG: hypothetical protein IPI46_04765 [Bacteroidetes bacterium]|nr:hypothetical protein [Bacteroidota bacterium]